MRALIFLLAFTLTASAAFAQQPDYSALNDAISKHIEAKDTAALKADLAQADDLVAKYPSAASAHWSRARALSGLGRKEEAIVEYTRTAATPAFATDAHYNVGVILEDLGRRAEAMAEYRAAIAADPKNTDAAYNLAQNAYLDGDFAEALDKWLIVKRETPDDFQTSRKLVQAYWALGREADALRARDEVLRIRTQAKDPAIAKVADWVFDQIVLPKGRVYAREPFASADFLYRFQVMNEKDDRVGELVFIVDGDHWTLRVKANANVPEKVFTTRPAWRDLKPMVRDMALVAFPAVAKPPTSASNSLSYDPPNPSRYPRRNASR
jgi:tetratricopeptide (TPR) repeat protein